jgi:NTP pyrophosphatase (non-canonical NTP hydrolase)
MKGDHTTTLMDLKKMVESFAVERDWQQFHSPKNLAMAVAAESGELLELFIWCSCDESDILAQTARRNALGDELSDIVIYCMAMANRAGIDVADSVRAKMAKNAEKYPVSLSRGNSDKYTELQWNDA